MSSRVTPLQLKGRLHLRDEHFGCRLPGLPDTQKPLRVAGTDSLNTGPGKTVPAAGGARPLALCELSSLRQSHQALPSSKEST